MRHNHAPAIVKIIFLTMTTGIRNLTHDHMNFIARQLQDTRGGNLPTRMVSLHCARLSEGADPEGSS